jgi:hypothetical protein
MAGKGIYIRTLCQKNEGSVETKKRPTKMGGRITATLKDTFSN